jgi:hypothetical protein
MVTVQLFVPVAMALILFGQPGPRDGETRRWALALLLTFLASTLSRRAAWSTRSARAGLRSSALSETARHH